LSLNLLLDEDSQVKYLINLLQSSGHNVLTVNEIGIMGFPDDQVLDYSRQFKRCLLTRNCDDFYALHQANPTSALATNKPTVMSSPLPSCEISAKLSLNSCSIRSLRGCLAPSKWICSRNQRR